MQPIREKMRAEQVQESWNSHFDSWDNRYYNKMMLLASDFSEEMHVVRDVRNKVEIRIQVQNAAGS